MSTRKPLTMAEKQLVYDRKMKGVTLRQIARELRCSEQTARKWWRIQRDKKTVQPRGRPARGVLSTFPATVRKTALEIKTKQAHLGSKMVRLKVAEHLQRPLAGLPSSSRLAVFFKEVCPEAVQSYERQSYPNAAVPKATEPHQRWQIDAKENVSLAEEEVATVFNGRDPFSGVILLSDSFCTTTQQRWRKLTLEEIRSVLRQTFITYGLPTEIQTDHEHVYTGSPDRRFPSIFTLWLVGLGIKHVLSRVRRPTDQGSIERTHRTLGNMVWKDTTYHDVGRLQCALDAARLLHNERYPSQARHCNGQPPLVAHPDAHHSGRHYCPSQEAKLFDLSRVDEFLATLVWTRQVNTGGMIRLAGNFYYVGRRLAGQTVSATFMPETRCFRMATQAGEHLADKPVRGLEDYEILGFHPDKDDIPTLGRACQLALPL